jgi:hypothetical protein
MAIPQDDIDMFVKMGEDEVRLHYNTGGFGHPTRSNAGKWLAAIDGLRRKADEDTRERSVAAMERSLALAQSANKAAWVAAVVAIGAAIVALAAWIHPIH